jgi:hypothetical protein
MTRRDETMTVAMTMTVTMTTTMTTTKQDRTGGEERRPPAAIDPTALSPFDFVHS